jgi:hypothetical protein
MLVLGERPASASKYLLPGSTSTNDEGLDDIDQDIDTDVVGSNKGRFIKTSTNGQPAIPSVGWGPIAKSTVVADPEDGRQTCFYEICLPGGSVTGNSTDGIVLKVTDDDQLMIQVTTPAAFQSTDHYKASSRANEDLRHKYSLVKHGLTTTLTDIKGGHATSIQAIGYLPLPFPCTKETKYFHVHGDNLGTRIICVELHAPAVGYQAVEQMVFNVVDATKK